MVLEGSGQFLARHTRLQRLWVEIGGDYGPGIVVPIGVRRRTWAPVDPQPHRALAADELVGRLAELALVKSLHVAGDAIDHHMRDAGRGAAFGIEQQEGKALDTVRRV